MKKYFLLVTCLSLSTANILLGGVDYKKKTLGEMASIVTGAHVRAFSVKNLFAKPLDADGLRVWHESINHVHNYVKLNSKNMLGITDKSLMHPLYTIEQANFELLKHIKKAQRLINKGDSVNECANEFSRIKEQMVDQAAALKELYFDSKHKMDARDLLYNLAYTIESTAIAAENHIYKYLGRG